MAERKRPTTQRTRQYIPNRQLFASEICDNFPVTVKVEVRRMIGDRIKSAMELRGINQKELAEKLNTSQVTVSRYVNNRRTPKPSTIVSMARVLGVTVSYLMEYSDRPGGVESDRLPSAYVPAPVIPVCRSAEELANPDVCQKRYVAPPRAVETHPGAVYVEVPDDRINRKVPRGYIAMVDLRACQRPGSIYCVSIDGELVFGVLTELTDGFELDPVSWDPTARPVVVDNHKSLVEQLGVVVRATMPDWYEL